MSAVDLVYDSDELAAFYDWLDLIDAFVDDVVEGEDEGS